MSAARAGTVLILIAGIAAVIATLCTAFLVRMRSDVDDMQIVEREAQGRIMLIAACSYVQEASRLGYDPTPLADARELRHREAHGWIDVRDGESGPLGEPIAGTGAGSDVTRPDGPFVKLYSDALVEDGDGDGAPDRPAWPAVKGVARCPMDVEERPPFAISPAMAPNAIADSGPDFGMPYLTRADPQPAIADKAQFWFGDRRPRASGGDRAWFRVRRDEDAVFVVACGAGGTRGYRDWNEVRGLRAEDEFGRDQMLFEQLLAQEPRAWYRIEWSATVAASEVHNIANALNTGSKIDQYVSFPMNTSDCNSSPQPGWGGVPARSQAHCVNMGGTIRWVQRLRTPPTFW